MASVEIRKGFDGGMAVDGDIKLYLKADDFEKTTCKLLYEELGMK